VRKESELMKLTLNLPDLVRVVNDTDEKGSDATVILFGGVEVLTRYGHVDNPESLAGIIASNLASHIAGILLRYPDGSPSWLSEEGWATLLAGGDRSVNRQKYECLELWPDGQPQY
jgi:hypothetical protein